MSLTVASNPIVNAQNTEQLNVLNTYLSPHLSNIVAQYAGEGVTQEVAPHLLEKFVKELRRLFTRGKNQQQIARELSQCIPVGLQSQEVVNLIFENCHKVNILPLLDAAVAAHSSFALSPYDIIRKAIVADTQHLLTNSSFMAMMREHGLDSQEDKMQACYDLAYRMNHPNIYRISATPTLPSDYTLNFLWVNLNPQDRILGVAQNIFGEGLNNAENAECIQHPDELRRREQAEPSSVPEEHENWEKIKRSVTYRISRWADMHPNAQINMWYDSALVTQRAQQNTSAMMRSISQSRGVNLRLRDIRQLPLCRDEIASSLHPGTQLYYRVDISKASIADYMISAPQERAKYCVVSDIDIAPMAPAQIFDQRTVDYLSSNGYVFNRVGLFNFENSFFIFNREKANLQKNHNETVIQATREAITSLREFPINTCFRPDGMLGAQCVFNRYSQFRTEMGERVGLGVEERAPRKVVTCPRSQFEFGGDFPESDYRAETFRFIGSSNIPYTRKGRNPQRYGEAQISELINWTAQPLPVEA